MANNKQLAKNSLYNTILFIINLGISFFFTPYLIRVVGKEAYSFFPLVNNIIGYSSIITVAVSGMAGRFMTISFYKNDIDGANCYFNSVLVANWILSVFFTIISIFFIIYLPSILTIPEDLVFSVRLLFAFACGTLIVGLSTGILGIGTFIKNRIDVSASRNVVTNLFRVGVILLFFAFFVPSIVYMSLAAFCASILSAFFNYSFKNKYLPELTVSPHKYFRRSYLKELIGSSAWNSLDRLSFLLITQLDLLITNILIGVSDTADYSIAKMIPSIVQSFIVVMVGVFMPHFTVLYAKDNRSELLSEISKSIRVLSVGCALILGFLMVFGDSFFNLWIPNQASKQIYLLSILTLIPMIVSSGINPLFNIFTVTNKLKIPSFVLLVNGMVNVVISVILIKYTDLGVYAIPIVSMITLILKNLLFTPIYAAKCLNLKPFKFHKDIIFGMSSCIIVIIISVLLKKIIIPSDWVTFVADGIMVLIISSIICGFVYLSRNERKYVFDVLSSKIKH